MLTTQASQIDDDLGQHAYRRWPALLAVLPLLLVAGYLLFCHGCHGEDVDDEARVTTRNEPRLAGSQTVPRPTASLAHGRGICMTTGCGRS